MYQPFSRMLQFALEPLILAASGSEHAEPPGISDPFHTMAGCTVPGVRTWAYRLHSCASLMACTPLW